MMKELSIRLLPETFCISKLPQFAELPRVAEKGEFCFISRTDDELSIICPEYMAPTNVQQESGMRGLKLVDSPGIDSIGIATTLTLPLTRDGIPFIVITTYSSIFIFVREEKLVTAVQSLQHEGFKFVHEE